MDIKSETLTKHDSFLNEFNASDVLTKISNKYKDLAAKTKIDSTHIPRTIKEDGSLKGVNSRDWTSGFFSGMLWYLYEYSKYPELKSEAIEITSFVEKEQYNGVTHDMGFKIGSSVGNGYRLMNDIHYKDILVKSAETLITRFNPTVGCIRSWDHSDDKWGYPVIIDNMMNLELLFEAYKLTGNKKFYDVALSHADVTMKNHFRKDNSSYHVIDYNPVNGNVVKKNTHQGYSHESIWARGQAWGLYGYTLMYRETKDVKYLEQANKIAALIFKHENMPNDLIPYWDYLAPNLYEQPRDVSAAAITASALLELQGYITNDKLKKEYTENAKKIIEILSSDQFSEKRNEYFILNQSTGSFPSNSEVNVPLVYADYYFVEALLRLIKINN
ncbi:glucuronyl hydrolase [Polaribacter filamentus]|uniref:Glucuronyl hydrolase n=1 Tax=Polaribacter filamentus TaxID=53483 RepID=A0A2S7L2D0_9FLAO|nr:glucuronyl hydrolase [Polaribacter filamentus]